MSGPAIFALCPRTLSFGTWDSCLPPLNLIKMIVQLGQLPLPNLFDAIFTTKESGEGTGLGLSLARDIVASHGGMITVDSTVGQGTEFVITLPRSGKAETVAEPVS